MPEGFLAVPVCFKPWLSAKNILHGRFQRAHGREKWMEIDGFDVVPDKNQ